MSHNELSHLDPQCLSSSIIHLCILIFNIIQFELTVFENFAM